MYTYKGIQESQKAENKCIENIGVHKLFSGTGHNISLACIQDILRNLAKQAFSK